MAEVIMITSGKGGVGKSTVCTNLGMTLALDGYKVCMVDADIGLKNLDLLMGLENRVIYDMNDVLQGNCSIDKAMIKDKHCRNLYLLPACKTMHLDRLKPNEMKLVIDELRSSFDYILIDSPAGIESGFHQALSCSDRAIVVIQLEITSLHDADRVIGLLQKSHMKDIKAIVNRVHPPLIRQGIQLKVEDAIEWLSIDLLGIVYEDPLIVSAKGRGNIRCLDQKSLTYECFQSIKRRLNHENASLPKYREKRLWEKLFG